MLENENITHESKKEMENVHERSISRGSARRLRVDDALSYLDQVKHQFADAPDVYVNFLDVMKDFKSQTIDTPGVIRRVSRLFRGRTNLIMGFNTFLPVGFDVCIDGQQIIISEPSGRRQIIDEDPMEQPTTCPVTASRCGVMHESVTEAEMDLDSEKLTDHQTIQSSQSSEVITPSVLQLNSVAEPATSEQQYLQSQMSPKELMNAGYDAALAYVAKVKNRYQNCPEVYHKFLDILHKFQQQLEIFEKEEPESQISMEKQIFATISEMFSGSPDLLREFSLFLPNAYRYLTLPSPESAPQKSETKTSRGEKLNVVHTAESVLVPKTEPAIDCGTNKRSAPPQVTITKKKARLGPVNVVTYTTDVEEASKYVSPEDFIFFDKVRKALGDSSAYDNFLRCMILYNQSIITKYELIEIVSPFIGKFTLLMKYFKELIGLFDSHVDHVEERKLKLIYDDENKEHKIDYATCRRLGVSYRSLPDSFVKLPCSGRTELCNRVLNDRWVSFPSWSSEDTSCVHSKKTQFEEFIFRTEDERYELDIIIEVNKSALETLETIERKLKTTRKEDLNKFTLDSALGGPSPTIMYRALRRIYGDYCQKVLEGAQANPQVMVPRLIERMRQKDMEWRKAQSMYNKIWREETEKHYTKSLDHQAITFKQNDLKMLKSKTIINHFENLYDEREERNEQGDAFETSPHCIYHYPKDISILYDVNDLVIHYVKRQANIQKDEKRYAKRYLKRHIPELFNIPAQELSDEEDVDEDNPHKDESNTDISCENGDNFCSNNENEPKNIKGESEKLCATATYRLFYGANTWCIFLRLHHLLCDRLAFLKQKHQEIVADYEMEDRIRRQREESIKRCRDEGRNLKTVDKDIEAGLSLLKPKSQCPSNFYRNLISEIKNLLDGIIEVSAFEDSIRNMFGTAAYLTFTVDKIVSIIARQLQAMSSEELNISMMDLYQNHRCEKPVNVFNREECTEYIEELYEKSAQEILANQNCFKTFFLHESRVVSVELIDTNTTYEDDEKESESDQEWSSYVRHYVKNISLNVPTTAMHEDEKQQLLERLSERPPMFLMKHIRMGQEKYRKREKKDAREEAQNANEQNGTDQKYSEIYLNEDLHMRFHPSGNYKLQFVNGSADLMIRRGALRKGIEKHRAIWVRRNKRFSSWLEERLCDISTDTVMPRNWLAENAEVIAVKHPVYCYIIYNRYVTSNSRESFP